MDRNDVLRRGSGNKSPLLGLGSYGGYGDDDDEPETLVHRLHHDAATRAAFVDFEYIREDGTSVVLGDWDAFVHAVKIATVRSEVSGREGGRPDPESPPYP